MDKTLVRPYLVIPKLIEQPTWGGTYITQTKNWQDNKVLAGKKIGQSYELYDKSNLSLLKKSDDPEFIGELTNSNHVKQQSVVANSVPLSSLILQNSVEVLGKGIVDVFGPNMPLLLKFTQALGNSFQLHIPDGVSNSRWKPKPESWYYFEPGLITCGVRKGVNWEDYKNAVTELDKNMQSVAFQVINGHLVYEAAKKQIDALVKRYNPWQYVNLVRVEKGTLLDLSPCGIHHSWEEDLKSIPLGNVLYEIQLNVMDDVSTLRSFDKGKMSKDGTLRSLQIEEYFAFADRSEKANDPETHMRAAKTIAQTPTYTHDRILESKYYSMDRIRMPEKYSTFTDSFDCFRHIFVRSGSIKVTAGDIAVVATAGHSVFIPAGCFTYTIESQSAHTEILISY